MLQRKWRGPETRGGLRGDCPFSLDGRSSRRFFSKGQTTHYGGVGPYFDVSL